MNSSVPSKTSRYRQEIDGLRAFAVVAVIINHFNKDILPGGYLGVDIFFVISGYVIASSLYGRPSKDFKDFISGFYERRIKRLVPTLAFFVLMMSLMTHLIVQNAGVYYKTGALSLFGVSNIYLSSLSGGYWGFSAEMNPFTQTWSLGVEEQFYVLFPFLIWFSGFGQQKRNGSRNLFLVISPLAIASLVRFFYLYPISQSEAYFLMPSRFWEMAAGCLIFIGYQKRVSLEQALGRVPPLLVLILIVGAMYLPMSLAVSSTISVVILTSVLIASLKKGTAAFKVFTNSKVIYIGLISYSLYLWHWGVLVLARWSIGVTQVTLIPLLLLITLLSYFSYEFIENKTRRAEWSQQRMNTIGIGVIILLATSFVVILLGTKFKARFYLGDNRSVDPPQNILPLSNYYVIGDSHASDVYELLKNNGSFDVKKYQESECAFFENYSGRCRERNKKIEKLTTMLMPGDVVIFSSKYLDKIIKSKEKMNEMILYFKRHLPALHSKGVRTVLKLPHPNVNRPNVLNGFTCKKEFFRPFVDPNCFVEGVPKSLFEKRMKTFNNLVLKDLAKEYPKLLYWRVADVTCPDEYCYPVVGERQYLVDSNHLFVTSPSLSDALIFELNEVLSVGKN